MFFAFLINGNAMSEVVYKIEKSLGVSEFIDVLKSSSLAERRPVNDGERIAALRRNANLIITARLNGKLIGVARSITDYVYGTYLSDLAVDIKYQKKGIGKRLIEETKKTNSTGKTDTSFSTRCYRLLSQNRNGKT